MIRRAQRIRQLDEVLQVAAAMKRIKPPRAGWIKTLRVTLGISMKQVGDKMDISKQGVQDIEDREMDGRITLNVLRNVARAMEMELVYVLLPKAGSVEKLVEGKAEDLVFSADPRPFLEKMLAKEEYPQEFKRAVKLMIKKYPKELWD